MDQNCMVINHCCFLCIPYIGGMVFHTVLRNNLRVRAGAPGNPVGDCLAVSCICCSPCAICQEIRSVPVDAWKWYDHIDEIGCYEEPCKFFINPDNLTQRTDVAEGEYAKVPLMAENHGDTMPNKGGKNFEEEPRF
eukprot:CAMPEP_0119122968 /NCGR_PEP_ID=MMETSP1310-20130426/3060_1 /TAXON_ID=464262 /ORGANISM="Genus nov. species nov., Strain RCC2339" /LENGTH=135 /DNA_ID=CAMNT_0007112703 /DNA_START=270 /DNA_END=677 /DNA_ORIENTATION=-